VEIDKKKANLEFMPFTLGSCDDVQFPWGLTLPMGTNLVLLTLYFSYFEPRNSDKMSYIFSWHSISEEEGKKFNLWTDLSRSK